MAFKIYRRLRYVLWKMKFVFLVVFLVWTALMAFVFVFVFYATRATPPQYDAVNKTVAEMVGRYSNYDAGGRAAMQHIAAQLLRYPQAKNYTARYYETSFDGGTRTLKYDRDSKKLLSSGGRCECNGSYENVTEKMIQEVAARRGKIDDFKKLGGVSYP